MGSQRVMTEWFSSRKGLNSNLLYLPCDFAHTIYPQRPHFFKIPDSSTDKESTSNAGDPGLIPGSGRSNREGKGYPLQYSGLENSVHGVTKSRTRLSHFRFHLGERHYYAYHREVTFLKILFECVCSIVNRFIRSWALWNFPAWKIVLKCVYVLSALCLISSKKDDH